MLRFLQAHYRVLTVVAVITACVGVQVVTFLNMKPAPVPLISYDLVSYLAALLQKDNPALLTRDTIYGSGQFSGSIWYGSAYLYMSALTALYKLTQGDWWLTYGILVLITLAVYLVIAYRFFVSILPDWRLALAMTLISSVVSHFSATSTFWGIPPNTPDDVIQLIPQVWYNVFSVFVAWLIVRAASAVGDGSFRIAVWKPAGLGLMVGISIYVIHSISAIALIEISILSALVLVLRRRLSLRTVAIYGAVALPFLAIRLFAGSGSATAAMPLSAAQIVIGVGHNWMVFPWLLRFRSATILADILSYQNLISLIVLGSALYALLSIVFAILARRDASRRRLWKILFLVTQAGLCLATFRAGWVPILVLIYGCFRVWREEEDELDRVLLTVMMVALIAGPIQQMIMVYVWAATGLVQITAILYEMARFEGLAYLPLYALAGRAIWELSVGVRPGWLRFVTAGALCLLVRVNLASTPIPLGVRTPWQALLGLLALALILARQHAAIVGPSSAARLRSWVALAAALTGAALVLFGPDAAVSPPVVWAGLALAVLALLSIAGPGRPLPGLLPGVAITLVLAGFTFATSPTPLPAGSIALPEEKALVVTAAYISAGPNRLDENARDYLAAAQWAQVNTPVDSLFHIADFNANFRVLAQRSILLSYTDIYTLAIYSGSDSSVLFSLWEKLSSLLGRHRREFTALLAHNHVDYVLAWNNGPFRVALTDVSECGWKVSPTVVYQNKTYVIYQLSSVADASADTSVAAPESGLLCPLPPAELPQVAPAPCGAARVPAGGPYAFSLRDYPACTLPAPGLTVRCLSGDRWTAGAVSGLDSTSVPGEVSFSAQPPGICGLFPAH